VARLFPAEQPLAVSIDRTFELAQVNEALEAVRTGHSRGKTLLSIHADQPRGNAARTALSHEGSNL
ncbi:zinc-binding dehydrogenase, partial [Ellagibacter isourolithinifaciens]|uniref:zinc-binding dehydrogenase n=1 Tax=Ellagibacter isourolithinifaciens TaxID=2137581 RepID=UPI0023F3221C